MAIQTAQVAVSTVATELTVLESDNKDGSSVAVTAPSTGILFVGPAAVTAATGYPVPAGATLTLDLAWGERLFGILSTGSGTASVLRTGV